MSWHFPILMIPATALATLAWDDVSSFLAVLTPLVAVPLGAMAFYLRSIREQQLSGHADVTHRLQHVEGGLRRLVRRVTENERDFTAKEDWLRESMLARQNIERLTEAFARMEAGWDMALPASDHARGASGTIGHTGSPAGRRRPEQETR